MNRIEEERVVITGLGVVAPNGVGVKDFLDNLQKGTSGIRRLPELTELGFRCEVGGEPQLSEYILDQHLSALQQKRIVASGVRYGVVAGLMAWTDSGITVNRESPRRPETGVIMGAGMSGGDIYGAGVVKVNNGQVKRLGSVTCPNSMSSSSSAFLGGLIGAGNQVTTNASACASGTEALILGADRIRLGYADRMLCGACDSGSKYVRAGFDAMRVLNSQSNTCPEQASCPMSERASGFVPGAGGGAYVLERLSSARARGARIYAEVLGGAINSGGQREGGTMTAPNPRAIESVIQSALKHARIHADEVDVISGHLTGTKFDPYEIECWRKALGRSGDQFPAIQALKSLTGHALSAAGALEAVALTLQLHHNFLHPNANCEPIHSNILSRISAAAIPTSYRKVDLQTGITASFGFGDVNACAVLRNWNDD
jgi:3-oxoacyl-(acyl-carrier-protein) synthase